MPNRRIFLQSVAGAAAGCLCPSLVGHAQAVVDNANISQWQEALTIRRRIRPPAFAGREFDIRAFGARGDNIADNTQALADAIAKCADAGGGRVLVSGGVYRTGPIHLRSNVNLHIDADATLSFATEPERYLPPVLTRWEGVELMGYSPLIYAYGQTNIAVTGAGTLNGNADRHHWWPWKGGPEWGVDEKTDQRFARARLFADAEKGVDVQQRVYADGAYLRPPFIQTYDCSNVLIESVTIVNSPFWLIHPVLCENVTIRGVTCKSHGPNSDGCDPESCRDVLIENCLFDTGDDCVAVKSGRNADGRRLHTPCENILVSSCRMLAGHGGVVIGSEISGGARNIFVEDCHMSSPDLERAIRVKTNSVRGGSIENINVRNVDIGVVQDVIVINFYYEEGDSGTYDPSLRNIAIEGLRCDSANRLFYVRGYPRAPIQGMRLDDINIGQVQDIGIVENVQGLSVGKLFVNGKPLGRKADGLL